MSDTKIQWHPGFVAAMDLEFQENRESRKGYSDILRSMASGRKIRIPESTMCQMQYCSRHRLLWERSWSRKTMPEDAATYL